MSRGLSGRTLEVDLRRELDAPRPGAACRGQPAGFTRSAPPARGPCSPRAREQPRLAPDGRSAHGLRRFRGRA